MKHNILAKYADIVTVKIKGEEFFTIREMADILEKDRFAIRQALFRAGIEPVSSEALYDNSALEYLRNVPGKGRPKKAEAEIKTKNDIF